MLTITISKVALPEPLIKLDLYDKLNDGTIINASDYAKREKMVMEIDGDMITVRTRKDTKHYTDSYLVFRDAHGNAFPSASRVKNYCLNSNSGYSRLSAVFERGITYYI